MTFKIEWATEFFPGTPLREADVTEHRVMTVEGHPNAKYAWDSGIAIGRYLQELKEGRILGCRCHTCDRIVVPPRIVCSDCFKPIESWVYVKDTGTVNTFSVSHVAWNAERLDEPEVPAVIELDGASKGIGILHKLAGLELNVIRTGLRVQAIWKQPNERTGAITDILYFTPI